MAIVSLKKAKNMGYVHAEIELINGEDILLARRYIIGEEEIKRLTFDILVDTGSYYLAINENIQEQLQFPVIETEKMQLANGYIVECKIVGPVELRFKNRGTTCRAIVLPGNVEPLLGVIPLEGMDVLIDTTRQELIVNPEHPDYAVGRL